MKSFDIIVIGGGVVGAAVLRELSKYKMKIALLEKETELAFGVSKSNSGIIHPGTQNPINSLKGKLCVEGNNLIREIAKEVGVDFQEVGELIVGFNEEDRNRLIELKKEAEILGVKRLSIVDRAWFAVNEPNLSKEISCALYAPTAGIISPYRLVYDLTENAVINGAQVFTDNKVEAINKLDSSQDFKDCNFEVRTNKDIYLTKVLINCAGLFADEISNMVGVNDFKITPRKGEEFLLDKKKENITNHLIFPLPTKTSKGVLVIKTSDGNPMIGPTAQNTDDRQDLSTSKEGFDQVVSKVKRLVPSINPKDIISYFAGLRPVVGDDFIIRHEEKVFGFINVAGIQSPGLTAAPAIAKMVVGLIKSAGIKLRKKIFFKRFREKSIHLFNLEFDEIKKLVRDNSSYGDIVCRCEMVSKKEIEDAIERGAKTLDGIKFRTRAQAGRCHGGFCTPRLLKILSEKQNIDVTEVTKRGGESQIVKGKRYID